jgi:hypothetical protein
VATPVMALPESSANSSYVEHPSKRYSPMRNRNHAIVTVVCFGIQLNYQIAILPPLVKFGILRLGHSHTPDDLTFRVV